MLLKDIDLIEPFTFSLSINEWLQNVFDEHVSSIASLFTLLLTITDTIGM